MIHQRVFNLGCLKNLLVLALALPLVACSGGDGGLGSMLSWVAPTERADNTPLALSEIAGFRIYYGVETGNYLGRVEIDDPTATQAQVTGIPPGTYFAVVTTVDVDGRESLWSAPELRVSF